jgi:hypothetical protein
LDLNGRGDERAFAKPSPIAPANNASFFDPETVPDLKSSQLARVDF